MTATRQRLGESQQGGPWGAARGAHLHDAISNLALIPLPLVLVRAAPDSEEALLGRGGLLELGVTRLNLAPLLVQLLLAQLASHVLWQVGWVFRLLLVIVLAMIAPDGPAEHLRPVEVVHREHGAPLILRGTAPAEAHLLTGMSTCRLRRTYLITDEGEALGLPCRPITRHVNVYDLAELRAYHDHIALTQPVCQPTNIDIGAVLILRVPGLVDVPHASVAHSVGSQLKLQVLGIDAFDLFHTVHATSGFNLQPRLRVRRGRRPPALVATAGCYPAIERYVLGLRRFIGLQINQGKSACFSRGYNLEGCPWRQRAGVPVGTVALAGVDGAAGPGTGIMVGGVPIGEPAFVTEVMRALVAGDVSYIETTVTQLRDQPHAAWAALFYSCAPRFDYWLRHMPPNETVQHAAVFDCAMLQAAEQLLGYVGI